MEIWVARATGERAPITFILGRRLDAGGAPAWGRAVARRYGVERSRTTGKNGPRDGSISAHLYRLAVHARLSISGVALAVGASHHSLGSQIAIPPALAISGQVRIADARGCEGAIGQIVEAP
jgi:hypothetical protein